MEDLSHDFDVLAERADDCGALWAVRLIRRFLAGGEALPPAWPGTIVEARRLVETFTGRVGFTERENLAKIVQSAAEWTWADSLEGMRSTPPRSVAGRDSHPIPSISWHLEKLSVP
jgi:hypothetical protein